MRKRISILLLLIVSVYQANAKLYFIIEPKAKEYKLTHIKLNGLTTYGVDEDIDLFNLLYDNRLIVLYTKPSKHSWSEINIKDYEKNSITFSNLKKLFEDRFEVYKKDWYAVSTVKREDILPIIKINGKYYVSENGMVEYFYILNQPLVFPNLMGNAYINISSPSLSIKEFETRYVKAYHRSSPNAITSRTSGISVLGRPLEKPLLFFSDSLTVFGYKAYKFWQFTDWPIDDAKNYQRGIDRFVFVPQLGIIGGSFDAFFEGKVDDRQLYGKYLKEEIILPKSAKDIVL